MIDRYTHKHRVDLEGFLKHDVEVGSSIIIYIPSFVKTGSSIPKLMEGGRGFTDAYRKVIS
jgi:hypothetical protein